MAGKVFKDLSGEPVCVGSELLGEESEETFYRAVTLLGEAYDQFVVIGMYPPLLILPPMYVFYGSGQEDALELCDRGEDLSDLAARELPPDDFPIL
jgi:hypothetical protein